MSENYSYTPPEEMVVYDPDPPPFVEDPSYDVVEDGNNVANLAFGDDLKKMEESLRTELNHMLGCKCLACTSAFQEHVQELYEKTRIPNELTGESTHSLLHQYILHQYGKL